MNITVSDYTEEMVDKMVQIYLRKQVVQGWVRVEIKESTKLYRNVQTGELRLQDPEVETETEGETHTTTTSGETMHHRKQRKDPRETETPREREEEQGREERNKKSMETEAGDMLWKCHERREEKWIGEVRVLHSYKRHRTVFQCDMEEASRMVNILERVARKEEGEKGKWKINNPEGCEENKERRTRRRQKKKNQANDTVLRWKF